MALVDDVMTLTDGKTTEAKATIYLNQAKSAIMNHLYPYGTDDDTEMPSRYENLQLRIAVYLIDKEGAEGETTHSEGGVSRGYSDADIPKSMLSEIVPMVKVL